MMQFLKQILKIQELDMNMVRLLDLRGKRQGELDEMALLRRDLQDQLHRKEHDILEMKKQIKLTEGEVRAAQERVKEIDVKQASVRKVEEFNALTKELSDTERGKVALERQIMEMEEKLASEEEIRESITESLSSSEESSRALEKEIESGIAEINAEGKTLRAEREKLTKDVEPQFLKIYDRLLANKRDRVVVPIENRTCSGCHIVLTAQHENLVRKCERLVFCEHCSRILYWEDAPAVTEGDEEAPRRRRRRSAA